MQMKILKSSWTTVKCQRLYSAMRSRSESQRRLTSGQRVLVEKQTYVQGMLMTAPIMTKRLQKMDNDDDVEEGAQF